MADDLLPSRNIYMIAQRMAEDRRQSKRFECNKPAVIRIDRGVRVFCTVLNVSTSGALIGLKSAMVLPRQFELLIAEDLFQAECELRHQNGSRAGVMFTSHLTEAFSRFRDPPLAR